MGILTRTASAPARWAMGGAERLVELGLASIQRRVSTSNWLRLAGEEMEPRIDRLEALFEREEWWLRRLCDRAAAAMEDVRRSRGEPGALALAHKAKFLVLAAPAVVSALAFSLRFLATDGVRALRAGWLRHKAGERAKGLDEAIASASRNADPKSPWPSPFEEDGHPWFCNGERVVAQRAWNEDWHSLIREARARRTARETAEQEGADTANLALDSLRERPERAEGDENERRLAEELEAALVDGDAAAAFALLEAGASASARGGAILSRALDWRGSPEEGEALRAAVAARFRAEGDGERQRVAWRLALGESLGKGVGSLVWLVSLRPRGGVWPRRLGAFARAGEWDHAFVQQFAAALDAAEAARAPALGVDSERKSAEELKAELFEAAEASRLNLALEAAVRACPKRLARAIEQGQCATADEAGAIYATLLARGGEWSRDKRSWEANGLERARPVADTLLARVAALGGEAAWIQWALVGAKTALAVMNDWETRAGLGAPEDAQAYLSIALNPGPTPPQIDAERARELRQEIAQWALASHQAGDARWAPEMFGAKSGAEALVAVLLAAPRWATTERPEEQRAKALAPLARWPAWKEWLAKARGEEEGSPAGWSGPFEQLVAEIEPIVLAVSEAEALAATLKTASPASEPGGADVSGTLAASPAHSAPQRDALEAAPPAAPQGAGRKTRRL
jgi:hypothetical protein